jgi:branched-chain amino acid aminotransferase
MLHPGPRSQHGVHPAKFQPGLNPNIKSLNYLNNILAKIEAGVSGAREAIMLSLEGYVAECTGDNIFFVKGQRLVTPPSTAGALEGITRGAVMELAPTVGLAAEERLFTPFDLYTADEVFLTGTAAEVIPVVKIDARPIGQGTRLIEAVPRHGG